MISRDEFYRRQESARKLAAEAGFTGLMAVGRSFYDRPGPLAYLTNHFPPFPATAFSPGMRGLGHGLFILPVAGDPVLCIDPRPYRKELVAVDDVRQSNDLVELVAEALREKGLAGGRVGLAGWDILPLAFYRDLMALVPELVLEPADGLLNRLRRVKSDAEIGLLRRAARVAGAGLQGALQAIRPGVTEAEVCAAGTAAALRAGADFVRYLRVHSGPWSAAGSRWPQATDRVLEPGELVALDIIGAYQGYQFDVNRSTVVGEPNDRQRQLLEAVYLASREMVEHCWPGTPVAELVRVARRCLDGLGFGAYAAGMMGHGIGLETVEEPYITAGSDAVLEPGMVLAVEPGVFIPGWGGANIEEIVVIRDGPPEVLTLIPARLW